MSIWDTVKEEFGDGPKVPSRSDFTTYFGYAGGEVLGSFPTAQAARDAGATTSEINFNSDGFEAARNAYHAFSRARAAEWRKRVRELNTHVNDATFDAALALAEERGHSYGLTEVEGHLDDYITFAEKVIAANK